MKTENILFYSWYEIQFQQDPIVYSTAFGRKYYRLRVLVMSHTRFRVNLHSVVAWILMILTQNRRDIWSLSDSNGIRTHNHLVCKRTLNHLAKPVKWLSCVEYLSVWCIWLNVMIMSHTRFRLNPQSRVVWMSRNSLLETGTISVVSVAATDSNPQPLSS